MIGRGASCGAAGRSARARARGAREARVAALAVSVSLSALALSGCATKTFDLEGHRGARGLAPENTLPAFATALSLGVTTLELDTAITRDGVVVVSHDPYLNPDIVRGPDGAFLAAKGPAIHALTFAELSRYDVGRIDPSSRYATAHPAQQAVDGTHMPRLADVFALTRRAKNYDCASTSRRKSRRSSPRKRCRRTRSSIGCSRSSTRME